MFDADIATVSSQGQVAIPAGIRKALNIETGDKVIFIVADTGAALRKIVPEDFLHIFK